VDLGVLFYAGRKEAIRIDIRDTAAKNDVLFDGQVAGSVTSVETLRFHGGDADDRVETAAGYDVLQGGAGDDYLSAGAGDDTVNGGEGDDWLDGGYGADTVSFAGAASGITLDLRVTETQDTGGGGKDTIRNFENVVTTAFDDLVRGNDASNIIRDTEGGNDRFFGDGGGDGLAVFRIGDIGPQTIVIDGGDGDDVLEYASGPVYNPRFFADRYRNVDDVTVLGGAGNDSIYFSGQKTGVIDAGDGDDELRVGMGGLAETSLDITLGDGRDTLWVRWTDVYLGEIDRLANVVGDFETGAGGDRMQLNGLLPWVQDGTNLFAYDLLRLVQDGDDVRLQVDGDGEGDQLQWRTFLTFEKTLAEDFTADNFFITTGDGIFTPIEVVPIDPKERPGTAAPTLDAVLSTMPGTHGAHDPLESLRVNAFDYHIA
jgi:hypothetical protein